MIYDPCQSQTHPLRRLVHGSTELISGAVLTPELWIIYSKISQFRPEGDYNARNFESNVYIVHICTLAKIKTSMQVVFFSFLCVST